MISESLWRNRFASDPRLIGRTVEINNLPVTVVGVVPDRTSTLGADQKINPSVSGCPTPRCLTWNRKAALFTQNGIPVAVAGRPPGAGILAVAGAIRAQRIWRNSRTA